MPRRNRRAPQPFQPGALFKLEAAIRRMQDARRAVRTAPHPIPRHYGARNEGEQ